MILRRLSGENSHKSSRRIHAIVMQLQTSYLKKLLLFFWLFIFFVPVCGLHAQEALNRLPDKYASSLLAQEQDSMAVSRKQTQRKLEQEYQDSVRELLATGKADTIRYRYVEGSRVDFKEESVHYFIEVVPRVDNVTNRIGYKNANTVLLLLIITALLSYCFARLAARYAYKRRLRTTLSYYFFHGIFGLLLIYPILSEIYTQLDDIMIRTYGKEQLTTLCREWKSKKSWPSRGGPAHTYRYIEYNFLFKGADSIQLEVDQGRTAFDADNHERGADGTPVMVRYDAATHRLVVDDERYHEQNFWQLLLMGSLLGVIFLASCGKLNRLLYRIKQIVNKNTQVKEKKTRIDVEMPCILSTCWPFTTRTYESMDALVRDVKYAEYAQNLKEEHCLVADRIAIEDASVTISIFDEDITGSNDLNIQIVADNGKSITEGELLFKLHHRMMPYLRRLNSTTLEQINLIVFEGKDGSKRTAAMLIFSCDIGSLF